MRGLNLYKCLLFGFLCLNGIRGNTETLFACMYNQNTAGGVRKYNTDTAAFLSSFGTGVGQIQSIAFAPNGDAYVTDAAQNKIVRYNASGQLIGVLVHDPNFVNLDAPHGIAFGPDGMLYVSSFYNYRILKYHPTTGEFLGVFAQGEVFDRAINLVFRPDGVLYATGYHGGVQRYDAATGEQLPSIAPEVLSADSLIFINNVMYVSDFSSNKIWRYDTPLSAGVAVIANVAAMSGPTGLALDSTGRLYVGCYWTRKILRFNSSTFQLIDTFVTGDAAFTPNTLAFNNGQGLPTNATVSGTIALQESEVLSHPITFEFRPRPSGTPLLRTQTLTSNGSFSFNNIPRGDYDVAIKGAKWLKKVVRVNASAGDVTNVQALLRAGDANNDNAADISDLFLLIAHYNQIAPAAGYSDACDFNSDNSNDISDVLLLLENYNRMGDL